MMAAPVFLVTMDLGVMQHWQQAAAGHAVREAGLDWPELGGALVLLDMDMKGIPAWSDPWWVARTRSMRIVALSMHPSEDQGYAALSAGCSGYCHAIAPQAQLKQVLAVVTAGGIWAGRSLLERLLTALNKLPGAAATLLPRLSDREREVAQLAARGASNKVIARELGISERTVKAHISAAFEKLQVTDRVQLALKVNGIT